MILMRLLRVWGRTAYGGEWKVGIIADADRMNEAAANKLLKTLEEPPRRV